MFYEEARELLISLEEGLMELERRQSDRAHLDKTFRAAHSLKGAAAMVGLAAIAEFTHGIEAVLERIRAGVLAVDSDIITTLLEARDHLSAMVEAEAAGSPIPPSGELMVRLTALVRGPAATGSTGAGPLVPPALAPDRRKPARSRRMSHRRVPARLETAPGKASSKAKPAPKAKRKARAAQDTEDGASFDLAGGKRHAQGGKEDARAAEGGLPDHPDAGP